MANVTSLKAVRTRYRNTLEREISKAKVILSADITLVDTDDYSQQANMCNAMLKTYSSKLNEQMNKLLDVISETNEDLAATVVEEDCELLFHVEQAAFELTQFVETIQKEKMKETEAESKTFVSEESERIVSLQEEMHKLMLAQMNQQREFFEKQAKRESLENKSVKLPKLELNSFNGDKIKWKAFWDAFECTVHSNKKLSNIERFNYLLTKLTGEAQRAVAGLALSDENYSVAVGILKERFGKKQEIVDIHYKELMNIPAATTKSDSVKALFDSIEKHLRSLEVLGENVNQDMFVSMIRAKLPEEVLYQLEVIKRP